MKNGILDEIKECYVEDSRLTNEIILENCNEQIENLKEKIFLDYQDKSENINVLESIYFNIVKLSKLTLTREEEEIAHKLMRSYCFNVKS